MPPVTPRFPPWFDGDLVSASHLNDMMDWIDTATGLYERRVYPFDAGADELRCDVYKRPFYGYNGGSQVEYWLAHNGDQLVISLGQTDDAYLYWNWDGVSLGSADARLTANTVSTYTLSGAQMAGLYQYQPVRVMLRSVNHPNNSIFVNYLYQTDSNAPSALGTMPAFTNGTASSANHLNQIQAETEIALDILNQPVACQYSNRDRVGSRNFWNGYIRHTHSKFIVDLTVSVQGWDAGDFFYINYGPYNLFNWAPGENRYWFDGIADGGITLPAALTVGDWYKIQVGFNRQREHEQYVRVWSMAEVPGDALTVFDEMTRWTHGDTLNGSAGGPPLLVQMSNALDSISTAQGVGDGLWINQPCRVASSTVLDVAGMNCAGEQIIDSMSAYRVHRWLAYNSFRKTDGSYATATLQWSTGGRNLQSYTLPTVDIYMKTGFFDLESSPVKPGMWFMLSGVGFGIQVPTPGISYV